VKMEKKKGLFGFLGEGSNRITELVDLIPVGVPPFPPIPLGVVRKALQGESSNPSPQIIDARFDPLRAKKLEEWMAKGVPETLARKGLEWAEGWTLGIIGKIPEPEAREAAQDALYRSALDLADRWIQGLMGLLR